MGREEKIGGTCNAKNWDSNLNFMVQLKSLESSLQCPYESGVLIMGCTCKPNLYTVVSVLSSYTCGSAQSNRWALRCLLKLFSTVQQKSTKIREFKKPHENIQIFEPSTVFN
uniref:Uncharacterized protein n=1 Tax=Romanomermis culicivorax TaxID=13658 RepID=A0A915JR85_ROMCU